MLAIMHIYFFLVFNIIYYYMYDSIIVYIYFNKHTNYKYIKINMQCVAYNGVYN